MKFRDIIKAIARAVGVPSYCQYDGGKLYDYYGNGNSLKCPRCTRTYVWHNAHLVERGDRD
jgi:hypothetical protein